MLLKDIMTLNTFINLCIYILYFMALGSTKSLYKVSYIRILPILQKSNA